MVILELDFAVVIDEHYSANPLAAIVRPGIVNDTASIFNDKIAIGSKGGKFIVALAAQSK